MGNTKSKFIDTDSMAKNHVRIIMNQRECDEISAKKFARADIHKCRYCLHFYIEKSLFYYTLMTFIRKLSTEERLKLKIYNNKTNNIIEKYWPYISCLRVCDKCRPDWAVRNILTNLEQNDGVLVGRDNISHKNTH